MLKLCLKDYLAARWWWLLALVAYALYATFPLMQNLAFMIAGAALIMGCLGVAVFIEDFFKTEAYFSSLPLRRSTIVQARYLLAGLLTLGGGIIVFAYGGLVNSMTWLRAVKINLGAIMTFEGVMGYVLALAILVGLYFPFYFRFGLARGSLGFAITLLGLSLGLAAVLALLNENPFKSADFLKDPGIGIVWAIGQVKDELGPPLFIATGLVLTVGVFWISLRLSTRFYEKRDL